VTRSAELSLWAILDKALEPIFRGTLFWFYRLLFKETPLMPATDFKDYYKILGVDKSASESDIKKAFRKLARQYHPDLHPNDRSAEAKFKEISEANEVLSDTDKRQKYDQYGQYWRQMDSGFPGGGGAGGGGADFGNYGNFDEFINELLGRFNTGAGRGARPRTTPGGPSGSFGFDNFGGFGGMAGGGFPQGNVSADAEAEITLTFAEALKGTEKRLRLNTQENLTVRIPAGTKSGSRIRLRGKGQLNPMTQTRGDLYLMVKLQPHAFFKFEGDQLVCELPITPDEAVLGAKVEVLTPTGMVQVNLPAGIKSGQSLRLKGKGWPLPKGGNGDQLLKIQIVPPKELSDIERECYEKIAANRSFNPRHNLKDI
jgi:curved DNA-binding protein